MTDPDGLDIELIDARPAQPAENGRPARPAMLPGLTHAGLIVLDSDKAKAFYGTLFGGHLRSTEAPWLKGDFYDSAVGGHGNILRFFNESYSEAGSPTPSPYWSWSNSRIERSRSSPITSPTSASVTSDSRCRISTPF